MRTPLWFTMVGFHALVVFLIVAAILIYRFPRRLYYVLALFIGLLIAFIDRQVSEPQLPALLLLAFGFFLGAMQPARPWRWALIISIWVPLVSIAAAVGSAQAFGKEGMPALIALVPAFFGAYAGSFIGSHHRQIPSPP